MQLDSRVRGTGSEGDVVYPQRVNRRRGRPKPESVRSIHDRCQVVKTHVPVPLWKYLEEQEEPVETCVKSTQCDKFLPRMPKDTYIPQAWGVDQACQVDTMEIFDFDRDVAPLLGVIVGNTLDQALMETQQEELLRQIREFRAELERRDEAELRRIRDLEEGELRRWLNTEKLLSEKRQRRRKENAVKQKLAAMRVAKEFLKDMEGSALNALKKQKLLVDPAEEQARATMDEVCKAVEQRAADAHTACEVVDDAICNALNQLKKEAAAALVRREEAARAAAAAAKKKNAQLYIHSADDPEPIGPIELPPGATVGHVEGAVREWLLEHRDDNLENAKVLLLLNGEELEAEQLIRELDLTKGDGLDMKIVHFD